MSVYKVERKVDTVIMEIDIALAEKVAAMLRDVVDETVLLRQEPRRQITHSALNELLVALEADADVRVAPEDKNMYGVYTSPAGYPVIDYFTTYGGNAPENEDY